MKAIIFDVDGVLIDTEKYHFIAWVNILMKYNIILPEHEYHKLAGWPGDDIDKFFIDKYKLRIPYGTLVKQKEGFIYHWFKNNPIPLRKGSKELIIFVKNKGLKIGVASASPKDELILKLKKTSIYDYIDVVTSEDEVPGSKPDPEIYLRTAKLLNTAPKECIVIEDTPVGAHAGKNAGMTVIAVPTSLTKDQDFSFVDYLCNNLEDAKGIIEGLI